MVIALSLALMVAGQVSTAGACPCPGPYPTVEELIGTRPDVAIFVARVASVLSPAKGQPTVTRFTVEDVVRGEVPRVVEMTGVTFQDRPCGLDLRVGEVRTVAAYKQADGSWFTTDCLMPRP